MQHSLRILANHPLSRWNSMIQGSVRDGCFQQTLHLYSSLLKSGLHGDHRTLPFVAKSCGKLRCVWDGRKIHAHSIIMGFDGDIFVKTSLVDMYSKCSCLGESRKLFDEMPVRSLVSWNSMIFAYCKESQMDMSFKLLGEMWALGMVPNSSTLVSLASGFNGSVSVFRQALSIHGFGIKLGFEFDLIFSNSLMSMYVRYNLFDSALSLFEWMEEKSTSSWTIIVGGYLGLDDYVSAFNLFKQMFRKQVELDSVLFVKLVSASTLTRNLSVAHSVHALVIKCGVHDKNVVGNSLLNLYAKCRDLESAQEIFDSMHEKDVFSWTSMIGGYLQSGSPREALILFQKLLSTTIKPNEVTVITILSACANFGSLSMGERAEDYARANGLVSDLRVLTSLIDMYCRCGSLENAERIFHLAEIKDVALWTSMINGYAMYGMGKEALALFKEMQGQEDIKPDAAAFTGILSACSHSGLVEEGLTIFRSIRKDLGIDPCMKHYSCLVDLLSRAGNYDLASEVIQQMPMQIKNQVWTPLLSAYRNLNGLGHFVSEQLFDLGNQNAGAHVLVANAYASLGKWEESTAIRRSMNKIGLAKECGWSKVEANSFTHDRDTKPFTSTTLKMS